MKSFITVFIVIAGLALGGPLLAEESERSHLEAGKAQATALRFEEIIRQRPYREHYLMDMMLELSDYQDTLLAFMYSSADQQSFAAGLNALDWYDDEIRWSTSNYLTTTYNFYACNWDGQHPQVVTVDSIWGEQEAFLNTFKLGRHLDAEERELYFKQENDEYLADGTVGTFDLDTAAIAELEPEVLYNFALLPDGTVKAALERPGEKEYHVRDNVVMQAFTHPNHTILAGGPNQAVLAAGAFTMFQQDGKRLYFISSKSGHFQPSYESLKQMRRWFGEQGIDEATVVPVPDVDMAQHTFDHYASVEVPVLVTHVEAERMFQQAIVRWRGAFSEIDQGLIARLADGDLSGLSEQALNQIRTAREEANMMRSAYRLLTRDHTAPADFHAFVKRFGRLKDAIQHQAYDRVQAEAVRLLPLLESCSRELESADIEYADEESFTTYFLGISAKVQELLNEESLHMNEYHTIKKLARELSTLFHLLAEDNRLEGRHHFLYSSVANALFDVNKLMADVHGAYVGRELKPDDEVTEHYVCVTDKVRYKVLNTLVRLEVEPPRVDLAMDKLYAHQLAARASFEWYSAHNGVSRARVDRLDDQWGTVKRLLLQILQGEVTASQEELDTAVEILEYLREKAQMSLDLYVLLDQRHALPEEVDAYIWMLEDLIEVIRNNPKYLKNNEYVAANLYAYISDSGWPDRRNKLRSFQADSPEAMAHSIQQAVDHIAVLIDEDTVDAAEAKDIRDKARQLAVIFNLTRQHMGVMLDEPAYKLRWGGQYIGVRTSYGKNDGPYYFIEDYRTMSLSSYKSVALHLEKLVARLSTQIESGVDVVAVSTEERQLAEYLFNKLDNPAIRSGEYGEAAAG